jgi:hypothetical protein
MAFEVALYSFTKRVRRTNAARRALRIAKM